MFLEYRPTDVQEGVLRFHFFWRRLNKLADDAAVACSIESFSQVGYVGFRFGQTQEAREQNPALQDGHFRRVSPMPCGCVLAMSFDKGGVKT